MAIGDDRPGLTQSLADAIVEAEGNWLESHFATLGGKYVGSVLVDLPQDKVAELKAAVRRMDAAGFSVSVQSAAGTAVPQGRPLGFELVGKDRPGIVREVSTALAGLGVSIDDLETGTEEGAMFGGTLFRARARVLVPGDTSFEDVRHALETISGEIIVDFED
ncbi:MAG: ACT domain-containing protein [Novosphingobium sp.]|nr:ACT domain-containing protein [Novosphingobium sp.]MCP5400981.1 ACT domain-containing protein [Novosphingobium sp.]